MAANKRTPPKTLKGLKALSKQTKKELKKLTRRQKAGTITGRELKTGLQEVNRNMGWLSIWIHDICK